MGLSEFLSKVTERGIRDSVREFRIGIRRRTNWLENRSTHVFDRDWDVLVVLDACRVDLLRSVAGEYDFVTGDQTIYSVAPTSKLWLNRTFQPLTADAVCEVPWDVTQASDEETYQPTIKRGEPVSTDVEQQLKSLGYVP